MPNEMVLDMSNIPDYQIDREDKKELPKEMLNQLLLPPNPYLHPKSERRKWFRKRDLWYTRKARYLRKGWPEILAALGARFDRRKAFWRRQEREIDKSLQTLRTRGYTPEEIKRWAEENLLSFASFNEAVKEMMKKYQGSKEGKYTKPTKFFKGK